MSNHPRTSCASCNSADFKVIYDFGKVPLAGSFPLEKNQDELPL